MGQQVARGSRPARAIGSRAGSAFYAWAVATATVVLSVQIVRQVFEAPPTEGPLDCHSGLRGLVTGLTRAREAAAGQTGGERAALARFRGELGPVWQAHTHIRRACLHDPDGLRLLREVTLLRYAEEHAVRYEAVDVAPRRRRVRALEAKVWDAAEPRRPATGPAD